ncbi:omptin family outer membrane protease [Treponema sp. OMZ 840]|uniref:omptin family outer membrane protease n=1 Tax=Treponema sp. OMZ 840 TaxID=244313 RepID=UPI003D8A4263
MFFFCILVFSLTALNARSTTGAQLNPWFSELNISLATGVSYTTLGEFVYKKNSQGEKKLLSRLDWDKILIWNTALHLNCTLKRWHVFFNAHTAIPLFNTGFMQDKDWRGAAGVLTDLSECPVRLDSHLSGQANIAYRIWDIRMFSAGAGAGFEYIKTEVTAYNGIKLLPLPQLALTGNFINYKQELYVPWLIGFAKWTPHPVFETDFFVHFAPLTFAQNLDTHFGYHPVTGASSYPTFNKQFLDRVLGFAAVKADIILRFNIPAKSRLIVHGAELRLNGIFVPELQGKTYARISKASPFILQKQGIAGSSYRSFCISLAYCMRIR